MLEFLLFKFFLLKEEGANSSCSTHAISGVRLAHLGPPSAVLGTDYAPSVPRLRGQC